MRTSSRSCESNFQTRHPRCMTTHRRTSLSSHVQQPKRCWFCSAVECYHSYHSYHNLFQEFAVELLRCPLPSLAHAHLFLLVFRFGLRIAVRGRPGYSGYIRYIWMTPFLIILVTGKNLCVSSEGAAGSIEFWNVWLDTSVCGTLRWKPRHST